ncbi:MAG: hypothetical protein R3E78_04975 [Burkholderiaceae bacterium]
MPFIVTPPSKLITISPAPKHIGGTLIDSATTSTASASNDLKHGRLPGQ